MWSLPLYLLLGWFISSIALLIGERRGIRSTNPVAELPGIAMWWRMFIAPFRTVFRICGVFVNFVGEHIWRLIKG